MKLDHGIGSLLPRSAWRGTNELSSLTSCDCLGMVVVAAEPGCIQSAGAHENVMMYAMAAGLAMGCRGGGVTGRGGGVH
jgi:hypothetical protein